MNTLIRSVAGVMLGFLLVVNNAHALVVYYWQTQGSSTNFPSAYSVCPSSIVAYNITMRLSGVIIVNQTSATCDYVYIGDGDGLENDHYSGKNAGRVGDGCLPGDIYNNVIGGCEPPLLAPGETCADQTGGTPSDPMIWDSTVNQCVKFSDSEGKAPCSYLQSKGGESSYLVSGTILSGGYVAAPPTFASTSTDCEIQLVRSSKCVVRVSGVAQCVVIGEYSGEVYNGGTDINDALCPDGGCEEGQAKTTTDTQECVPVSNGAGGTTCTQSKETAAEGTQQCGTVNGAYQCIAKPPASSGIVTTITASSETLGDGSIKVTTVKSSDLTTCSDINTCNTTRSVTTSHSTTSPSGGTSTSSTCTGSCTNTGGGVETLPGVGTSAGTGTGSGTCTGTDCGEGEGGTADISNDCAVVPPCDGDPFQCAILRQAHIDTCKLMAGPTSSETAAQDAKINAEYAALDAHQDALDDSVTTLLGGFQSATSGGGGSGGGQCLPDIPFSVMGFSQTIEFSKACEPLSFVRLVLLAGAYLMAARIVSKEV